MQQIFFLALFDTPVINWLWITKDCVSNVKGGKEQVMMYESKHEKSTVGKSVGMGFRGWKQKHRDRGVVASLVGILEGG